MAQKCRNPACGLPHDPWVLCQVAKRLEATRIASTTAINGASTVKGVVQELEKRAAEASKQRWSRKAYNRYMNLYRQTRRAIEGGRACPLGPQKAL